MIKSWFFLLILFCLILTINLAFSSNISLIKKEMANQATYLFTFKMTDQKNKYFNLLKPPSTAQIIWNNSYSRPYAIANFDEKERTFQVAISITDNNKKVLEDAKISDVIGIDDKKTKEFKEKEKESIICYMPDGATFFAIGSSITRYITVAEKCATEYPKRHFNFIYAVRSREQLIFIDRLNELSKKENMNVVINYEKEPGGTIDERFSKNIRQDTGNLDKEKIKKHMPQISKPKHCYIPWVGKEFTPILKQIVVDLNKNK